MTPRVPLILHPLVQRDIDEAALWYERQSAGLGHRFRAALDVAFEAIRDGPERYARIYRDVRRVRVGRFPYSVYYVVRDPALHVIACIHGRRHPRRWQSRTRGL